MILQTEHLTLRPFCELEKYREKTVYRFTSREEADVFLEKITL